MAVFSAIDEIGLGNFKVVGNDVRISVALQARSHCQRLVVVHKMLKNSI